MPRLQISYEWTVEVMQDGDIVDSSFYDNFADIPADDFTNNDIGLVRNEGNEMQGVVNRYWAYLKDGKLPEYFTNELGESVNIKIPAKYHAEITTN